MGRPLPRFYSGASPGGLWVFHRRRSSQMALWGWRLLADPLQEGGVSVKEK